MQTGKIGTVSLFNFLALATSALVGVLVWLLSGSLRDTSLWAEWAALNVYFEADIPYTLRFWVVGSVPTATSNVVHPLYGAVMWFAGAVSRHAGLPIGFSLRALLSGSAVLSAVLMAWTARGVGASPFAAALTVATAAATAAFTHWAGATEHFAFSMPTIALPFSILAMTESKNPVTWILVVCIAGSMTISNAVSGGISALVRLGWSRAILVALGAIALLATLNFVWTAQLTSPAASSLLKNFFLIKEYLLVFTHDPGGAGSNTRGWNEAYPFSLPDRIAALLIYTVVAPTPQLRSNNYLPPNSPAIVDYDSAPLLSLGVSGLLAAASFGALAVIGVVSAARSPRRDVAVAAIGFLLFHTAFHLVWGEIVFLFVAHAVPSLAAIVAFALAGPWRRAAAALALAFVVIGGPHNVARFQQAADLANLIARINLVGAEP